MAHRPLWILTAALFWLWSALPAAPAPPIRPLERSGPISFETQSEQNGERLTIFASNVSPDVVDLRASFTLTNMRADRPVPLQILLRPLRVREPIVVLERIRQNEPFFYHWQNQAYFGDPNAKHSGEYLPPTPKGQTMTIANAFFGSGAHESLVPHAIDVAMPEGTPVLAARSGVVVRTKSDSNEGGPDPKYGNAGNYVMIRHDDGTYGNYGHFRQFGVRVVPGQLVLAGTQIGESGNTGWSTGPHLHFDVSVADGRGGFRTIPWQIRVGGQLLTPQKGMQLSH